MDCLGDAPPPPPPPPWRNLPAHVETAGTEPFGMLLLSSAVASTLVLSGSELDHDARAFTVDRFESRPLGDAAVIAGYVLPIVLPLGLYGVGLTRRFRPFAFHGAAVAQAVIVTFGATLALKVITGRPFPLHGGDPHAPDRLNHPDYAREWNPFQPALGVAWPSGHAAAAFAAAASLSASTADVGATIASYGVATGISAGMLVGDHHWLSDVVAGALVGQAVGDAVGRGFRAFRADSPGDHASERRLRFAPLTLGARGAGVVGASVIVRLE